MVNEESQKQLEIIKHLLEGNLDFHDVSGNYASHNFHSFPAKFPPQLPNLFITNLTSEEDTVLDPMVGSGTTLVEAIMANRKAIGFDIDPLAIKITKVKTTPINKERIIYLTRKIVLNASRRINDKEEVLEKFNNYFNPSTKEFIEQWFYYETIIELISLITEIKSLDNEFEKNFFEVAFSSIIITKTGGVSLALDLAHTRPHKAKRVKDKNGNILAGQKDDEIPPYLVKNLKPAIIEFEKRCYQNLEGALNLDNRLSPFVQYGDAQDLSIPTESIDLIITSPPYASNAIDYMRAHKFSLVWLGYPIEDLSDKRKDYIGGESLIDFEFEELPESVKIVVKELRKIDEKKSLVLLRYFSEMKRVLIEMLRVLKPGKVAILVVGNSIFRGVDAQVPNSLREIGLSIGFKYSEIGTRNLDRNRRMMPTSKKVNIESQIQQRMHEEFVIAFIKGERENK